MALETVDVTIIGGGPVGLFAACYAGMRGMTTRIVDSLDELGGQLMALYPEKYVYDMPGFPQVQAKDLAKDMANQAMRFSPELLLGHTAATLTPTPDGYVLGTAQGADAPTRTVIIAAGAGAFTPTELGVEREEEFEGKGLYYGVRDVAGFKGKRVVIVGGGDSALDWCEHIQPVAGEVTLVHRREEFRAHEETVRRVRASTVKMRLWSQVRSLIGDDHLTSVTIEDTREGKTDELELDALVVNIGFKSNLGAIREWGLELDKQQIRVDRTFETNLPNVFAVGDVCTYEGKLKLIATGVGEAVTAVCHAKRRLDPSAKLFPGHSSDMDLRTGP